MAWCGSRWRRWRDIFRAARVEREIDEELRFHLEEETRAALGAGLPPAAARRRAIESLGDQPLRLRERIHDARGAMPVDEFGRDVRHAFRLLARHPGFAAVVLTTLGLAIGAAVTAFSISDAWLFRPLRFPAADRLVVAFAAAPARPTEPAVWMPYRAYRSWKESARSFTSVAAAFFQGVTWRTAGDALSLVGMRVSPEFFDTLGVPPLHGRVLSAADATGPAAVVLSHGFWQRALGGSPAAIGAALVLSDTPYTVVGVMPRDFDVRLLDRPEGAQFWTLLREGDPGYAAAGVGPVAIIARLRDGVDLAAARAEVAASTRRAESAYRQNFNQFVVTLASLQADNTRSIRATLLTVLAAALCLLVIAALNVGALLIGRGLSRRGEVAVRHALGAARARLVRQLLTESLVLSACGGVLGLLLAAAATRLFLAWNPLGTLPANAVRLDLRALAAAAAAMLGTALLSGLAPALQVSSRAPADALRGGRLAGRATAPVQRAQNLLLFVQMAVSVVLLVGTALLARTFVQLRAAPLGFAVDDVAVASVVLPAAPFASSAARNAFVRRLEERLAALPGAVGAATATSAPLTGAPPASVNTTAEDSLSAPRISLTDVTSGFFAVMDIPVVAGRGFDQRDDATSVPVVILNARAASDLFGSPAGAIGRRLRLDGEPWREVVGVVGDVRSAFFNTLAWRTDANLYRPAAQGLSRIVSPADTSFTVFVHIRGRGVLTAAMVRQAALEAGPEAAVVEVRRLTALVGEATRQPTVRMALLFWFSGASLLLAAVGVYGLVSQAVQLRLRELAVRVALGARPAAVADAAMRQASVASVAGVAAGTAAALGVGRTIETLLYGVRPTDGVALAGAAALLVAVAALAAWIPARRAALADPIAALRGD